MKSINNKIKYRCPSCDTTSMILKKFRQGCPKCKHSIDLSPYGKAMDEICKANRTGNRQDMVKGHRMLEKTGDTKFKLDDSDTMFKEEQIFNDFSVTVSNYHNQNDLFIGTSKFLIHIDLKKKTYEVDDYYGE